MVSPTPASLALCTHSVVCLSRAAADKDAGSFREYYAEMPWLSLVSVGRGHTFFMFGGGRCVCVCLNRLVFVVAWLPPSSPLFVSIGRQPFEDRARKGAVSGKFKVQGIPTLVWLNPDGR